MPPSGSDSLADAASVAALASINRLTVLRSIASSSSAAPSLTKGRPITTDTGSEFISVSR